MTRPLATIRVETIQFVEEAFGTDAIAALRGCAVSTTPDGSFLIDCLGDCFRNYIAMFTQSPEAKERAKALIDEQYQAMWRALHAWGMNAGGDSSRRERWFNSWRDKLRCPKCVAHLDAYISSNPLPFDEPEKLFEWTWRFHNDVNTLLGKPTPSLEEARGWYVATRVVAGKGAPVELGCLECRAG